MYGEHRFLKPSGTRFGLEWCIHFRILNQATIIAHAPFLTDRHTGMLMLDAYPRVCAITEASKIIFRPDRVQDTNMLPHYLSCSDPMGVQHHADTGLFRYLLPAYQVGCRKEDADET